MIKLALCDLYNGTPNLGLNNILEIIEKHDDIEVTEFDVRRKCELPSLDYDIYISSGGPGSPLDGDGRWDRAYYHLMSKIWRHNQISEEKKYCFFICHSFQMICHHLSLGSIVKRKSESFGVFPVHLTKMGKQESTLANLESPIYAADFRKWQFIRPQHERMERLGCKILAMEKIRGNVPLERAVMGVRFSPEWVGFQFHPEADPNGMKLHFSKPEKRAEFVKKKSEEKYDDLIDILTNPEKLKETYKTIIPNFLKDSTKKIRTQRNLISLES